VLKEFEILIFLKFGLFFQKKQEYFTTGKLPFPRLQLKLPFEFNLISHFWQNLTPKKNKIKNRRSKIISSKIHISSD
jgi:hypothetical protein